MKLRPIELTYAEASALLHAAGNLLDFEDCKDALGHPSTWAAGHRAQKKIQLAISERLAAKRRRAVARTSVRELER